MLFNSHNLRPMSAMDKNTLRLIFPIISTHFEFIFHLFVCSPILSIIAATIIASTYEGRTIPRFVKNISKIEPSPIDINIRENVLNSVL